MTDPASDHPDPLDRPISPLEAELFTLAPAQPSRGLDAGIAARLDSSGPFYPRFSRRFDRIVLATLSVGLIAAWIAIVMISMKVAGTHPSAPSAPPANSSLIPVEKPRGDRTPAATQPQNVVLPR